MKHFFLSIALVVGCVVAKAQVADPVQWSFTAKKLSATSYEVRLTATIESGWHIYSQTTPDGGPIPTAITFGKNPLITLDGKVKEVGKLEQKHEEIFGVDVKQYSNKVDFVQVVKLKGAAKTSVSGSVEFMVCNDKQCLPPETQNFAIPLK